MEDDDFKDIVCGSKEREEDREPCVFRDPGFPTLQEVDQHDVTQFPFSLWCPHGANGKAKDGQHQKRENQELKAVPEIVFDHDVLVGIHDEETLRIKLLVTGKTQTLFAYVVTTTRGHVQP